MYGSLVIMFAAIDRLVRTAAVVYRWLVVAFICICLFVIVMATFVANLTYGVSQRSDQYSSTNNLVAAAIIEFDTTESGQNLRCMLVSVLPDAGYNNAELVIVGLNELSRFRYGKEFCSLPISLP